MFRPHATYSLGDLTAMIPSGSLQWKPMNNKRSTGGSSRSGYKLTVRGTDFALQFGDVREDAARQYTVLNDPGASKANPAGKMWSVLIGIPDADVAAAKTLRDWFYTSLRDLGIPDITTLDDAKAKFRSPFVFTTDVDSGGGGGSTTSTLPKQNGIWMRWKVAGSTSPTQFEEVNDADTGRMHPAVYDYLRVQRGNHVATVATFWPLEQYQDKWSANCVAERVQLNSAECNHDAEYVPPVRAGGGVRPPLILPWFSENVEGLFVFDEPEDPTPRWLGSATLAGALPPLTVTETAEGVTSKRVKISDVKLASRDGIAPPMEKHYINYADRRGNMTTALADLRAPEAELPYVCFPPTKYADKVVPGAAAAAASDAAAAASNGPESKTMSLLMSFTSASDIAALRGLNGSMKQMLLEHFDIPNKARENVQKKRGKMTDEQFERKVQEVIEESMRDIKLPMSDPAEMALDFKAARQVVETTEGQYAYEDTPDRPLHFSASMRVTPDDVKDTKRVTRIYRLNAKSEPFSATLLSVEGSLTRGKAIVPVVEWNDVNRKDGKYRPPLFLKYGFEVPGSRSAPAWGFIGEADEAGYDDADAEPVAPSSPHA